MSDLPKCIAMRAQQVTVTSDAWVKALDANPERRYLRIIVAEDIMLQANMSFIYTAKIGLGNKDDANFASAWPFKAFEPRVAPAGQIFLKAAKNPANLAAVVTFVVEVIEG